MEISHVVKKSILLFASLFSVPAMAQERSDVNDVDTIPRFIYSIGGGAGLNSLMNITVREEKLVKKNGGAQYSLFVNSQANPLDTAISVYDRVFGFPTLEAGVQLLDYGSTRLHTGDTPYNSSVGCVWNAYIGFRRDIYRNRKWSFGYALENGLAYCSRPYEKADNVDNDLIGQHLSLYFGFGLYASYRIVPEVEVSIGSEYKHVSNGATDRPNKGANSIGLVARARCDLNRPASDKGLTYTQRLACLRAFRREKFSPYMYLDVNSSVGFRTMYEEWLLRRNYMPKDNPNCCNGKVALHTVWSCGIVPMVRYNQVHASGLGLEYSFGGYAERSAMIEQECGIEKKYKHSKHVLAASFHHEVYYKQLSLAMSLGTYLFRQHGWVGETYEPPVIETVGIRYYPRFFKPFYLGYNLKANLGKAYSMELKVGMHAGHWNLRKRK